jgi:hypothetical protein
MTNPVGGLGRPPANRTLPPTAGPTRARAQSRGEVTRTNSTKSSPAATSLGATTARSWRFRLGFFGGCSVIPPHAPELLAMRSLEQFAERAERDVRLLRERNPGVSNRQLAVYFKHKYSRAAR